MTAMKVTGMAWLVNWVCVLLIFGGLVVLGQHIETITANLALVHETQMKVLTTLDEHHQFDLATLAEIKSLHATDKAMQQTDVEIEQQLQAQASQLANLQAKRGHTQ